MQLVQLQQSQKALETLGYSVAAVSYDRPELLADFAKRKGITYPLIADPQSRWLTSAGLLDSEATGMTKGMSTPATLVLDPSGKVDRIYLESAYQDRLTPAALAAILKGEAAPGAMSEPPPEKPVVTLTQSDVEVTTGSIFEVGVKVALPKGNHMYGKDSKEAIPVSLVFEPHPFLEVMEVRYPEAKTMELLGARVPIYEGRVEFTARVKVKSSKELRARMAELANTPLKARFEYQICTESLCLAPKDLEVVWNLDYLPLDLERSPEELQHKDS